MEQRGFVRRVGDRFAPGFELARLARVASPDAPLVAAAEASLRRLSAVTGETATLGIREGDVARYVAQASGTHILGVGGDWRGRATPLHASATGKVLLAFGQAAYEGPLRRLTERTIVDVEALGEELELVRARGYATIVDELEDGLTAVAAPVVDAAGRCVAAVAVTGPTFRVACVIDGAAASCVDAGVEIGRRLSGRAPTTRSRRASHSVRGDSAPEEGRIAS
jgi:DNA-binding IclR family transcriptional regulator